MIRYTEKGYGLHLAIQAAGHWLMQIDGVWKSDDDEAVQTIIDNYVEGSWPETPPEEPENPEPPEETTP